jgi:Xaa-Pro aminopeptidase
VAIRNNDVEHDYRQDSDFYYLTGFDEPESVLVLSNEHKEHRMVLFVRERDPERETWDGPRAGTEGAKARFGADAAFPIEELSKRLPEYLTDVARLVYRLSVDREFDTRLFDALDTVRSKARGGIIAPREFIDRAPVLHEMRLRKDDDEIALMAKAADITRDAHVRAMQIAKPGRYEYEVEAEINRVFRAAGCERPAYGSIVGSGPNATILHHRRNDRLMEDGDLLLIDAGCEYGYYASDVTRTFPVSGKFTEPQRLLYEVVLNAQLASIAATQPGATLTDVHNASVRVLTQGLIDLGIIAGPLDDAISNERFKPFYMHRTSHWLGMDVHDVGDYYAAKLPRPLEPGFVLTVEPGLYVSVNAEVDAKWRGIGIRIEDDVLVTDKGSRNLTAEIPKSVNEIETLLASRG